MHSVWGSTNRRVAAAHLLYHLGAALSEGVDAREEVEAAQRVDGDAEHVQRDQHLEQRAPHLRGA